MKTSIKLTALALTAMALFFTTTVNAQAPAANALRFSLGLETSDPTATPVSDRIFRSAAPHDCNTG